MFSLTAITLASDMLLLLLYYFFKNAVGDFSDCTTPNKKKKSISVIFIDETGLNISALDK